MKNRESSFWKEVILHKKTYWRATSFEFSNHFFKNHNELSEDLKVLELGGSVSAGHQRTFPKTWMMEYSDYVAGKNIKYVFDANLKFPIEDKSYDGVVAYNTLPNLKEAEFAVSEMARCAKKFVLFTVPLVANIGSHPVDWTRWTEAKLRLECDKLKEKGLISSYDVFLIGGPFSCIANILDLANKWRITRVPIYFVCRFLDKHVSPKIGTTCPMQYFAYLKI